MQWNKLPKDSSFQNKLLKSLLYIVHFGEPNWRYGDDAFVRDKRSREGRLNPSHDYGMFMVPLIVALDPENLSIIPVQKQPPHWSLDNWSELAQFRGLSLRYCASKSTELQGSGFCEENFCHTSNWMQTSKAEPCGRRQQMFLKANWAAVFVRKIHRFLRQSDTYNFIVLLIEAYVLHLRDTWIKSTVEGVELSKSLSSTAGSHERSTC